MLLPMYLESVLYKTLVEISTAHVVAGWARKCRNKKKVQTVYCRADLQSCKQEESDSNSTHRDVRKSTFINHFIETWQQII